MATSLKLSILFFKLTVANDMDFEISEKGKRYLDK